MSYGETLQQGQQRILERIACAAPFQVVLDEITRWIEQSSGDGACSLLLVDAAGGCVRPGSAPSLPAEYTARLDGLAIGPEAGSCGTAAYRRERVIVEDIATHPYWERYRSLALPFGLRACWSSPILSPEQDVLGTFAIYYHEPRGPRPDEFPWVDAATHLAAIAILSERARKALQDSEWRARERVKELTLLHQATRLFQDGEVTGQALLERLVAYFPSAWQFSEQCVARVAWGQLRAHTPHWSTTPWTLRAEFEAASEQGAVEVAYLKAPTGVKDPFLPEEHQLIRTVADMLAGHLDRVQAQTALKHSEECLRAVIENTPDVAIQWYDGVGRLLFLNGASERILGLSQDALGKTLLQVGFWAESEEARFAGIRAATSAGEKIDPVEFQFNRSDGRTGVLLSTVFPISHPTAGPCSVCMDVDLSEHRSLESQLNQAQRLTALGTLAGGIAHDFNNLLVAIQGNAELALSDLASGHPAAQGLNEVVKASTRAADLVAQILTFSRKQEPKRERLELRSVIEEALTLLRASLPKTVQVHTELSSDSLPVLADSTQVHQVLMNLVTNASHASMGRGKITVSLRWVRVDEETAGIPLDLALGDYVMIAVEDQGSGMDEATLRRVFEPFFTTKPRGEGTGLGLSVAHGIMKAHGGGIGVSSRVGEGTQFRLYFPACEQSPESMAPRGVVQGRVLVVDDDEALTFLTQRVLSKKGHQVTPCASPVLALHEFRSRPDEFDLLVTDSSMPGMSGIELIEQCRALRPDLRVVLTSGYVRPTDVEAAARLGNVRVHSKPATADAYAALLGRLTEPG